MSENTVRLRNRRQQPVEVHLPYGVIVLPPGGDAVVSSSALATPQLSYLVRSEKVWIESVAPAGGASDPADAADLADARDTGGDQESEESPATARPAAAKPKRNTTRRSGRAPKP
jgi:hypothetical protein